jgi:photosystem II stability/assembly factor-like uncharacterized protein
MHGVSFVDPNIGTVVGESGAIGRTTDGGLSWNLQSNGTTERLNDVCFVDTNIGTAVGYSGIILHTVDGGETWLQQDAGISHVLTSVSFADTNVGIVVGSGAFIGEPAVILRTTNGGETWTRQDYDGAIWLEDVHLSSTTTGGAVGEGGTILRTTDGGLTWSSQLSGTTSYLRSVSFSSDSVGIAVGFEVVLRTSNAGSTWITAGPTWSALAVSLHHSDLGFAVAGSQIYRTANSGETWNEASSGSAEAVYGIAFADENIGIGVGQATIFRSSDGGTTWTTSQITGLLNDVNFADSQNGTAVGGTGVAGIIHRTTDAGITWIPQGMTSGLNAVRHIDTLHGTIVGEGGTVLHTTDGGASWIPQASGTTISLWGVDFVNADTGIIVGGTAPSTVIVLRTTNGGESWLTVPSPAQSALYDVAFANDSTAVAVGWEGIILRTSDGGATWSIQANGTASWLSAAEFGPDGISGVAVGSFGTILRTTDAGLTWASQSGPTNQFQECISDTKSSSWIIGGSNGTLLYSLMLPSAPGLILPGDSAVVASDSLQFVWERSGPEVGRYWFELSTDSVFSSSLVDSSLTDTTTVITLLQFGQRYWWRVRASNTSGWGPFGDVWTFSVIIVGVDEPKDVPDKIVLRQNYPNPFNPTTTIKYDLPVDVNVDIRAYDILGKEVAILVDGFQKAGYYEVSFDASRFATGIYFYRLTAGTFTDVKKLAVVK